MAVCTAGNRAAIWPQVDVASERPARDAGGRWRPYPGIRARAQLTLSRASASRFGGRPSFLARASLKENNGRPPNRLTRHTGRGAGKTRAEERREDLRRSQRRSYRMSAPLQLINVLEDWSRWAAQSRPMVLRAVATRATPAGLERARRL